ncbi:MAG: AAA family ATPase [Thermoplasmata archaeon]|nr:MAG: AAA family ATPase [Thermoplasmata archaeon]
MVTLKTNDGRTIEHNLSEMYNKFGSAVNFFQFYLLFKNKGIVEESELETYRSKAADIDKIFSEDYKEFKYNIPETAELLGRSNEAELIDKWVNSPDQRVLIITGAKGLGKSAVAAESIKKHQDDYHILWLNFSAGSKWENIIHSLAELAAMNNLLKLEKYVKHASKITPAKAYEIIAADFEDIKLLVVLDDIHNIKEGMGELGAWITPLLKFLPDWKILITSREPLPVELRSSNHLEGKYTEIKLSGLDSDTSRQLLKTDLSASEFESIYKYTEGNPLYLKAIRDLEADGKLDLKNFRPEELSLLKFLKIHEEID